MLSVKKSHLIPRDKKISKFTLYLFSLFIFFSISYFSTPKLLTFSTDSIKESLKNNNNIHINNILDVKYKIFPTPRLSIINSDFVIGEGIAKVKNSEIEIILNVTQILNFKEINYKKLLIQKGSSEVNLNNISQLLKNLKKNKKKITFKNNKIIFVQNDKIFFEITKAKTKMDHTKKKNELIIDGNFLNNKIFIKLDNKLTNKNNLIIKIPELNISTKIFFESSAFQKTNGLLNLAIFKNFLKFNFIKGNNLKIKDGFIRSKLVNSSLNGEVTFKPNFFIKLNLKPTSLNIQELFILMQKKYFSDDSNNLDLIKKINGSFNFESKFDGNIIFQNGEILFTDFKIGKNKSIYFNAKITEFSKKGKIKFNLVKTIQYNRNLSKQFKITGFIFPYNSKVIFETILLDNDKLSVEQVKNHENKFKNTVIKESLGNIFNENKLNKYFRNLIKVI
jgi:hypothetical protein